MSVDSSRAPADAQVEQIPQLRIARCSARTVFSTGTLLAAAAIMIVGEERVLETIEERRRITYVCRSTARDTGHGAPAQHTRASLAQARSMLWTLQQLIAKTATCERAEPSYLFELHQIAARGRDAVERVIADLEFDPMRPES